MENEIEFTPELKVKIDEVLKKFFKSPGAKKVKQVNNNKDETIKAFERVFKKSVFNRRSDVLEYVLKQIPDLI